MVKTIGHIHFLIATHKIMLLSSLFFFLFNLDQNSPSTEQLNYVRRWYLSTKNIKMCIYMFRIISIHLNNVYTSISMFMYRILDYFRWNQKIYDTQFLSINIINVCIMYVTMTNFELYYFKPILCTLHNRVTIPCTSPIKDFFRFSSWYSTIRPKWWKYFPISLRNFAWHRSIAKLFV